MENNAVMVHTLYVPSEMKQSSSAGDESKARDATPRGLQRDGQLLSSQ